MSRLVGFTILLILAASSAWCVETVVWKIGTPDNSYRELAIAGDYGAYPGTFPKDVTFRVGKDDPAKAWSFIHPGPTDAWAGSTCHPFTIIFDQPDEPKGVYPFTIDMVDTHGFGPPLLKLSVNGESGTIQLPKGHGDESLTNPAVGREHVVRIVLPARALKKGENKIVLSSDANSWFLYDAITLAHDPEAVPGAGITKLAIHPTMRFENGEGLRQIIEIEAEFMAGSPPCTGSVKVGNQNMPLSLDPPFIGSLRQEVAVPEVTVPTQAETSFGDVKAEWEQKPERRWLLFLQPSSHVDIGYTNFQEKVIELHNSNMSLALDLCRRYPGFIWNTEAAWVEDNYLSMMPAERRRDFITLARQGWIGCQAIYGNMLTGVCSHESFIRDLYYAHSVAKKNGIPFDIAMSSDVPTQVWTLPTVLAGSGIKYFSAGLNLTRGDSFNTFFGKSPFYWQAPDGSKVLTWFADAYAKATVTGLAANLDQAKGGVEALLRQYDREDYPYDAVLGFGGYWDNVALGEGLAKTVAEWNAKYAYPKVILCRGPEFFEYIEANFRDKIPTHSGDAGVYWEDGAGSSARETALVRRAKEDLVTAEKLYSLAGAKYPKAEFDAAWKNAILYDEHTWGAHCSVSEPKNPQTVGQWVYKARFAYRAADQSRSLLRSGLDAFAKTIKVAEPSVLVFNPLDAPMSGLVRTSDKSGASIELWAENVPALGYKAFPLSAISNQPSAIGHSPSPPSAISHQPSAILENRFYRLTLDPQTGAVKSLFDKELGRELVDQNAPCGLNRYLYVSGHDKSLAIQDEVGEVKIGSQMLPHHTIIRVKSSAYMTPGVVSEIVLWDDIKRIDFNNTLRKKGTYAKEAGYFAFPFAFEKPEFRVELPDGVVNPGREMFPGACMQWYCAQDFVAASEPGCTVVWTSVDAPLITLCDINRDTFKSPLPITNGHIYGYAFNNYWFTNYKASQSGQFTFRFSLTSMSDYDAGSASRFGRSVRNPLLARVASGTGAARRGVPVSGSLASVTPSNIIIQAVKPSESGNGTIIRLREVSGKDTTAVLSLKGAKEAWGCNLVEDTISRLGMTDAGAEVRLRSNGLATVLVR